MRDAPSDGSRWIVDQGSIGVALERDRLRRRADRVRLVLGALRERTADHGGSTPRPLRAAIEDFGRELAALERQLGPPRRAPSRG